MEVHQFINSVFNSNTFVVHNDADAIIVDLGDFEPVKNYLESKNLIPRALLITHTHFDHIYGVEEFMKDYPDTPIYTSEEGRISFNNPKWNFSRYHDKIVEIDSPQILTLTDRQNLTPFPNCTIEAIFTPGHDHSCITYRIGKMLFTGDSFIPGVKVIYTFPKSNKEDALAWQERLKAMTADFDIYPGHGDVLISSNKCR